MTWFADLSPCTYFDKESEKLLAVGWLEHNHQFHTGIISREVTDQFVELLWTQGSHFPKAFLGFHSCTLCQHKWGDPNNLDNSNSLLKIPNSKYNGVRIHLGCTNVFVPGPTATYVAPSLALHYMIDHRYLPPQEFLDALLACPPIGSEAYYQALEPVTPLWMQPWVKRRGIREPEMANVHHYQVRVSAPELEFKTNRHAIDARELAALVDAVLSIVREVCEQVPELMRAIISVYVRPQCPATVVLAHFTGAYPELSARLTERLCALSPELPVTAPTHVRLHFSIHPEYMPLARSGVSIA